MYYTGGKGRAYQHLINLMPPHRVYVETHLGGGAIMRHKRPAAINIGIDIDPDVISHWARRATPGIDLIRGDAVGRLGSFPFKGDELVYSDPPYVPETRRRRRCYRFDYTLDDHVALLDMLSSLACRAMISGYRCRLYDERLVRWRRVDLIAVTQAGPQPESVWLNFEPTASLHDYNFIGNSFRERERIRRRRTNLGKRFSTMAPLVVNAILSDLAASHPNAVIAAAERVRP